MRSGYMRYIQGIQPNVPARNKCRHGLYLTALVEGGQKVLTQMGRHFEKTNFEGCFLGGEAFDECSVRTYCPRSSGWELLVWRLQRHTSQP